MSNFIVLSSIPNLLFSSDFWNEKKNELVLPPLIIHIAIQQDTTRIEKHQSYFLVFTKHIVLFDLECSLCQKIVTSWNQVELVNCFVFGAFMARNSGHRVC